MKRQKQDNYESEESFAFIATPKKTGGRVKTLNAGLQPTASPVQHDMGNINIMLYSLVRSKRHARNFPTTISKLQVDNYLMLEDQIVHDLFAGILKDHPGSLETIKPGLTELLLSPPTFENLQRLEEWEQVFHNAAVDYLLPSHTLNNEKKRRRDCSGTDSDISDTSSSKSPHHKLKIEHDESTVDCDISRISANSAELRKSLEACNSIITTIDDALSELSTSSRKAFSCIKDATKAKKQVVIAQLEAANNCPVTGEPDLAGEVLAALLPPPALSPIISPSHPPSPAMKRRDQFSQPDRASNLRQEYNGTQGQGPSHEWALVQSKNQKKEVKRKLNVSAEKSKQAIQPNKSAKTSTPKRKAADNNADTGAKRAVVSRSPVSAVSAGTGSGAPAQRAPVLDPNSNPTSGTAAGGGAGGAGGTGTPAAANSAGAGPGTAATQAPVSATAPGPVNSKKNKGPKVHALPAFHLPVGVGFPPHFIHALMCENPKLGPGSIMLKKTIKVGHIICPKNAMIADILKAPVLFRGRRLTLTRVGAQKFQTCTVTCKNVPVKDAFNNQLIFNEKVFSIRVNPVTRRGQKHGRADLLVTFRSKEEVPETVQIGGIAYKVLKEAPAIRCFKCQSLDHEVKQCKAKEHTCVFCSGNHKSDVCYKQVRAKQIIKLKCANCAGAHKASDINCPAMKAKSAGQKQPQPNTQPQTLPLTQTQTQTTTLTQTPTPIVPTQTPASQQATNQPTDSKPLFSRVLNPKVPLRKDCYPERIDFLHSPKNKFPGWQRVFFTVLAKSLEHKPEAFPAIMNAGRAIAGDEGVAFLTEMMVVSKAMYKLM